MFVYNRYFYLFLFLIKFLFSTAILCSSLKSADDKQTPCFLESPKHNPLLLRTSGNSLVLPCHVAHSKSANVEWWYTDSVKSVNLKIYPVYPPVRPLALHFATSVKPSSTHSDEDDTLDASILLRNLNVDDSGIYRCVIRPETKESSEQIEDKFPNENLDQISLSYQVQLTGPRLCHFNPNALPCFNAVRTSSPTIIDAYQTAFLQCAVKTYNRPVSVFWVTGDSSNNSVLITDHLTSNQYNGDYLKRIFPLSPFDQSIELLVNHTLPERVYSCVITGDTDIETTIFTYIIRTIDLQEVQKKPTITTTKAPKHDTLVYEPIHSLPEHSEESGQSDNDEHHIEEKEEVEEINEEDHHEAST